jgi:ABC-type nitrate/sulfonate/bicarbonate transport system substrate-binding protein
LRNNPRTARHFVEATGRAIEWARQAPREDVVRRFESIITRRGRNEDASAVKYWKSAGVSGRGGRIEDKDFQVWIDWLVKDGQLTPGQLTPGQLFSNELNPNQSGRS